MNLERVNSGLTAITNHLPWRRSGLNERVEAAQPAQESQLPSDTEVVSVVENPSVPDYKDLAREYFYELLGDKKVSIEQLKLELPLCKVLAGVNVPEILDSIPGKFPFGDSLRDKLPELLSMSMPDPLSRDARRELTKWDFRRSLVKTQDIAFPKRNGLRATEPNSVAVDKTITETRPTVNRRKVVCQTLNTDIHVKDDAELEKLIKGSKCGITLDSLRNVIESLRTKNIKDLMDSYGDVVKHGPFEGHHVVKVGGAGRVLFHIDSSTDILFIRMGKHKKVFGTKLKDHDTHRSL